MYFIRIGECPCCYDANVGLVISHPDDEPACASCEAIYGAALAAA